MSRSLAVVLGLGLLVAAAVPAWAQTANIYVAFGDSITEGVGDSREPDEGYPTRLEALLRPSNPNATVRNRGLGGERTPEGLTRIDQVLLEGGDVLLLMEGTNDVSRRLSLETTRFNLSQMARKAEAQGLSVVHGTTIPRIPRAETDPENFANQDLNERVRDLAGNRNRRLADNFEVFGRQTNLFATLYYTAFDDKVGHPNGAGYDLMARTFFEAITGADTVAPVTGIQSPKHGARNVRASEQIAIDDLGLRHRHRRLRHPAADRGRRLRRHADRQREAPDLPDRAGAADGAASSASRCVRATSPTRRTPSTARSRASPSPAPASWTATSTATGSSMATT